jgi:hypothetical protein
MPIEAWIVAVCVVFIAVGFASTKAAFFSAISLFVIGGGLILWSDIACLLLAYSEDGLTGKLYWMFPPYRIYFCITRFSEVWRHLAREGIGFVMVIAGFFMLGQAAFSFLDDMPDYEGPQAVNLSDDPRYEISVHLDTFNTPKGIDRRIADAILESFKRRNITPPEGAYTVDAHVEEGRSKQKLTIRSEGKERKSPAPMLICHLEVTDANENVIYTQKHDLEPDSSLLEVDTANDKSGALVKKLWEDVVPQFQKMADEVKGSGAAPADGAPKPPAPDEQKN